MSVRTPQRRAALAAPIVAVGLLLGACGGSDSGGATTATLPLGTSPDTNYLTIPPATTPPETTDPATTDTAAGTEGVTQYTIQSGDIGIAIAKKFGITLQELEEANGWADASKELPYPGKSINIPAGATQQGDSGDTDTGGSSTGETGDTIPPSGDNCGEGKYTVKAGDIPNSVAADFGVSFDRLQAANPSIDFLTTFSVGLEIVIPAKENC